MKRNIECHRSDCRHVNSRRTVSQNNALHLYCQLLADELNAGGLPIKHVLSTYAVDLDWDMQSVKDLIWRPIQKALLGKTSTTELKKQQDIDRVYEHINRFIGEKFGVHVEFPNDPDKEDKKSMLSGEAIKYPDEECKDVAF